MTPQMAKFDKNKGQEQPLHRLPARPLQEPDPQGLLNAYSALETIRDAFAESEAGLEKVRIVPACVPNCGACCQISTPVCWAIEAEMVLSMSIGPRFGLLMDACEGWLLERHAGLGIYSPEVGRGQEQDKSLIATLNEEWLTATHLTCPFLQEDKRCGIYSSRPIVCQAYGITRVPSGECPRPLAANETRERQQYVAGVQQLQAYIRDFILGLKPEWRISWFLPTILFALGRPEKFRAYVTAGQVASAKLRTWPVYPLPIWQEQIDKLYASLFLVRQKAQEASGILGVPVAVHPEQE